MIELYYEIGKMPDRYYNQLNGKTAAENYKRIKNERKIDLSAEIKNDLKLTIENALADILNELNNQ